MRASVIVNVHSGTHLSQFKTAAESILSQKFNDFELVIVVSDAPTLLEHIKQEYGTHERVRLVTLEEDNGLTAARNAGAVNAVGDIVVFTDDDIIAEPDWLPSLVEIYEKHNPVGVGGQADPLWPCKRPWFLPPEFYWLVGVMHENFVDKQVPQPVRNTFGCNISFDRDAFLAVNGFREDLGKNQKNPLQGEEAELCERIDGEFWYTPKAVIHHKVDQCQLTFSYLLRRSFWQGFSKAALPRRISDETSFLTELITNSLPQRLKHPSLRQLGELAIVFVYTITVGLGFIYGILRGDQQGTQ